MSKNFLGQIGQLKIPISWTPENQFPSSLPAKPMFP